MMNVKTVTVVGRLIIMSETSINKVYVRGEEVVCVHCVKREFLGIKWYERHHEDSLSKDIIIDSPCIISKVIVDGEEWVKLNP